MALVEPALTGYMIQRPTHLEVNVKSPLIHKLISNRNDSDDMPIGLSVALSQPHSTLIDSLNRPNLTFLKNAKLDKGVKVKFKGVILQDDVTSFEQYFPQYVATLIKFLQKPKQQKLKTDKDDMIIEIRKGLRYDKFGWVHYNDCLCIFSNLKPIRLCTKCAEFSVQLIMGDDSIALNPTGEGREKGLK